MVTPKATRCASMCWRIITAHPGITARGIATSQTDYDAREVAAALGRLEAEGLVEQRDNGWRALERHERAWRVL